MKGGDWGDSHYIMVQPPGLSSLTDTGLDHENP